MLPYLATILWANSFWNINTIFDQWFHSKILKSIGPTEVITSQDYKISGENIILNDKEKTNLVETDVYDLLTDEEINQIGEDYIQNEAENAAMDIYDDD